jgi:hypothetical protein
LPITEGSKVVVESSLVPDYNGLTGEVTLVKGDVWDPSSPVQYRVKADQSARNARLLAGIGSPYIDLARPWNFWFVREELKEV